MQNVIARVNISVPEQKLETYRKGSTNIPMLKMVVNAKGYMPPIEQMSSMQITTSSQFVTSVKIMYNINDNLAGAQLVGSATTSQGGV